jgi:glutamate racemase
MNPAATRYNEQPIGIFDSGVGGLTVLRTLIERFPNERFIYLGDTARLPYGSKSRSTIRGYVEQNIYFLLKYNVKAIVIACNSASSVLMSDEDWPVPVYEVINPGSRKALAVSINHNIGVIGTRATVDGLAYVMALSRLAPQAQVFQQACPLLVPLVEEGWEKDPLTNLIVYRYLNPLKEAGIDTLILGCTHYPILKESIANVMGSQVQLIDSAEEVAALMERDIASLRWLPSFEIPTLSGTQQAQPLARFQILTSDGQGRFHEVAQRIMGPHRVKELIHVDIRQI